MSDQNEMSARADIPKMTADDAIAYVDGLIATITAQKIEIARLQSRQITPEMWALLDEAKAAGKEGNGGREYFALRDFLNRLESLRGGEGE
jgi:hypothetical protein